MIVLGIDPGYAIVGWGLVEFKNNSFRPLRYGAITTEADTPFNRALVAVGTAPYDEELAETGIRLAGDFLRVCADFRRSGSAAGCTPI